MSEQPAEAPAKPPAKAAIKPTLASALVEAQKEMPKVAKDATNPHFKSRFVSLDALIDATRPVLNDHDLAIVQFPAVSELGQPVLRTILIHGPTGLTLEADMPLLVAGSSMQQLGAAITYARRYAWAAVLGVASEEDDDGESAAPPASSGVKLISDAQRRRLFAIAKDKAVTLDQLRQIITDITGDPEGSTQAIPADRYDDIVALVEALDVPF